MGAVCKKVGVGMAKQDIIDVLKEQGKERGQRREKGANVGVSKHR